MVKIIYKSGNALDGDELYLAHGCNNKGVMGSGIAKQIRKKYPIAYEFYRWNYTHHGLQIGEVYGISTDSLQVKYIFNCITQDGYGNDGTQYVSYDAIKSCIKGISKELEKNVNFEEVAMPKIGAGFGGGDWNIIEKIIEDNSTFQPVVYTI